MQPVVQAFLLFVYAVPVVVAYQNDIGVRRFYATTVHVKGKVEMQSAPLKKISVVKDTKLYAEQIIQCRNRKGDCVVKINRCNVIQDEIRIRPGRNHTFPAVSCDGIVDVLYRFRAGGRNDRRGALEILSPTNFGAFLPESIEFRWTPISAAKSLVLSIEDPQGIELWSENVKSTMFAFSSDSARRAVVEARDRGQLNLTFVIKPGNGAVTEQRHEVTFALLPQDEARLLERELIEWEREGAPMLNVARGAIFLRHELYAQAAAEFEQALPLLKQNLTLLRLTISAQSYNQNWSRVSELCTELSRLNDLQPHCSCSNRCN
jgi:hypothetical protein